ncbi:hypothetical protein AXF42_Ash002332 [Apostasia shenzhenica]|uniref:Tf2-1-like SH3-like domain-containing protein n=1 Tax=Apostasia shenzhenica TaxID=1088818 RepID=A0A2I0AN91_9ASPA|nr:hypothetical protein AXF42_Ash002332 [Apostasia shenzhenica]
MTHHRKVEFQVGDQVFLKVSPMRGIARFGRASKLNPRYVGPFKIVEKIGVVAYQLALPTQMSGIHNVFHVSLLRKFVSDPTKVINFEPSVLELKSDLSHKEKPMKMLINDVKRLRNKKIPMVKVL